MYVTFYSEMLHAYETGLIEENYSTRFKDQGQKITYNCHLTSDKLELPE